MNSHFMGRIQVELSQRKRPLQARSAITVDAMFEATIQVLLENGVRSITTTRVASRAGVSVGTLYQYFPNREALLAAVLERHLTDVVEEVERACANASGHSIGQMAESAVTALIAAKFRNAPASKALYSVASEVGGAALVDKLTLRLLSALTNMLATADVRFKDISMVSFVVATSLIGPVQALLASDATCSTVDRTKEHLVGMISAYLTGRAIPRLSKD